MTVTHFYWRCSTFTHHSEAKLLQKLAANVFASVFLLSKLREIRDNSADYGQTLKEAHCSSGDIYHTNTFCALYSRLKISNLAKQY